MKATGRSNLRKHERASVELPIVVGDATNRVKGQVRFDTHDLSGGGAFIRSDLLFEIGEELGFEFTTPSGRVVRGRCRVVRVTRDTGSVVPGMGVEFLDLSDGDRSAIVALVTRGAHG